MALLTPQAGVHLVALRGLRQLGRLLGDGRLLLRPFAACPDVRLLADVPKALIGILQCVHWHENSELLRPHELIPVRLGRLDGYPGCSAETQA